jgi:hypothetical protein
MLTNLTLVFIYLPLQIHGSKICAWRDPWTPRESNHLPRSSQGRCRYRWVADFLLPEGAWNLQRLEQYFTEENITEILKIQPSQRNDDDFVAWFPEKRGNFTVKSAYRLGLNCLMQDPDRGATSCMPDGERPAWKLIWDCPVPPKVKASGVEGFLQRCSNTGKHASQGHGYIKLMPDLRFRG